MAVPLSKACFLETLKYTEKDVYYHIKEKLNETKASRDRYIAAFIAPVQKKLEDIQRGLTTSSTAIFIPFITQELFQTGAALDEKYSFTNFSMSMGSKVPSKSKR